MLTYSKIPEFLVTLVCLCVLFSVFGFYEKAAVADNILTLPEIQLKPKETDTFGLALSNTDLVGMLQIRFTYNSTIGFQITKVTLTSRTTGYELPDFQIDTTDPKNVKVLALLYSVHGAAIIPGTGDILTFHYQTSSSIFGRSPLVFIETLLSDIKVQPLPAGFENGVVSTPGLISSDILREQVEAYWAIPEPAALGFWLLGLFLIWRYRKTHFN